MGTKNLGASLTREGRIRSIGRITFRRVDYFSSLLKREGYTLTRCTVERLMKQIGTPVVPCAER